MKFRQRTSTVTWASPRSSTTLVTTPRITSSTLPRNHKIPGLMSDETGGEPIKQFRGLRAKLYSLTVGSKEVKRAKGVEKSVVKHHIKHQHYCDILENSSTMRTAMTTFRHKDHQLYTVRVNKLGLSAFDDKRYILADGVTTLAYGHFRIAADEIMNSLEEED